MTLTLQSVLDLVSDVQLPKVEVVGVMQQNLQSAEASSQSMHVHQLAVPDSMLPADREIEPFFKGSAERIGLCS